MTRCSVGSPSAKKEESNDVELVLPVIEKGGETN